MKITRYVHSCLLLETPELTVLVDPGQFSWESGLIDATLLPKIDVIAVTHQHFDHFSLPFITAVLEHSPTAKIIAPAAVGALLASEGIQAQSESFAAVEAFATNHESLAPLDEAPEHLGFHIANLLTHPGDSHHIAGTKSVLALPVTAPWGSLMAAAQVGLDLKPDFILPIHDWHWNETARQQAYERLRLFYAEHDIEFIKPQDGVAFEISV